MKLSNTILILGCLALLAIINDALSDVVILNDGNKYIGQTSVEGDALKITTPDGEMVVKKDRIKAVYKDASAIISETTDIMTEAQKLIAGANKIDDPKERNNTLDKSIEMLRQAQKICMDVIDVFSGADGQSLGNQLKEINGTMKHARSLKVLENEAAPPKEEPKPAPPPPEPTKPPTQDAGNPEPDQPEAKTVDPEKAAAAKEVYNLGLESFKNKKYEEALDFFLKAIVYNEDYIEAYAWLGHTYTALKDDESGYDNYKKFLELTGRLTAPSEELAKLREEVLKKTDKFKPIENKISELASETVFKLMEQGNTAFDNEDYLMAEEIFSFILRIENNNKQATEQSDKTRAMLEAEPTEEKAEENADMANTYYQSGLSLFKQNKYEEAVEKFAKAISYNNEFPPALCKLAECLEKTGDAKSAIKNYRLGLRCLQDKSELTKDEKEALQIIRRNLEKLDNIGNEARKLRDKHISGLQSIASECMSKKYLFLAARIYKQVLEIDPNNKTAVDALQKIQKEGASKKRPSKPITLFNGNDLSGLTVQKLWLNLWSVNKSCLFLNGKGSGEASAIQWEKQPPKNYVFSMDLYIEKKVAANNYEISFYYGGNVVGKEWVAKRIPFPVNKPRVWTNVKFTLQNARFKIEIDGKNLRTSKIDSCDTPLIGIYAQGYIVRFRNLTVEVME